MPLTTPYIPESIVVHLGRPDEDAPNVSIPFIEYVKNVASSELYPTWPQTALMANIYAITTLALNRIFTQYYRSRGYDFDITNTSQFDQIYLPGGTLFQNVTELVDLLFDSYVKKQGQVEPYFTSFCNGVTTQCEGLSQWGTVSLANSGYIPYKILQTYYGNDIDIKTNVPIFNPDDAYHRVVLRRGSANHWVKDIQIKLNRIRENFPGIPLIYPVDGVFGMNTEVAVREFQKIFNLKQDGIVGKATMYMIQSIYNGVEILKELQSDGMSMKDISLSFQKTLNPGDTNIYVTALQYYLLMMRYNYPTIPPVEVNGVYDKKTEAAVKEFQKINGLAATGIVNEDTFHTLMEQYQVISDTVSPQYSEEKTEIYPGYFLEQFFTGKDVKAIQSYLSKIAMINDKIPLVTINGVFDQETKDAVSAFQKAFGLPVTGEIGPVTWSKITEVYETIIEKEKRNNA